MSFEYKDQLVYEALQDMEKYRKEQAEIHRLIDEDRAKQPSILEQLRIMRNGAPYSDDDE